MEIVIIRKNIIETLYDRLIKGDEKLALIGLGNVRMPIVVEFAKYIRMIDFDQNEKRIQQYKSGIDPTHEVEDETLSKTTVDFTADEIRLREAKFLFVAVPTPINTDYTLDYHP